MPFNAEGTPTTLAAMPIDYLDMATATVVIYKAPQGTNARSPGLSDNALGVLTVSGGVQNELQGMPEAPSAISLY